MKKKLLCISLSLICLLFSFPPCASASAESWYVRRGKEHAVPTVEDRTQSMLKKYDAFYVNDACSNINAEKTIYLTFDVGYENGNVAKTLDILQEENVPGAFFVLSHFLKSAPECAERMINEGHLVCNHTSTHKNACGLSAEHLKREINEVDQNFFDLMGKHLAPYFRPPEGKYDEKTLSLAQKMGYKTVFWSLAYADWDDSKAPSDEKAKMILKDNTHSGAIVLLHPTSNINVRILRDMIHYWKNEGYRFGSLEELKGERE